MEKKRILKSMVIAALLLTLVISYILIVPNDSNGWELNTSLSDADASFIGEEPVDNVGKLHSISDAGDVNGDGYDDIIFGAYTNDEGGISAGQVYLFFGKNTGWSVDTDFSDADASFIGSTYSLLGNSVASAGDVNNDGYDDIIMGSPGNGEGGANAGQTYLVLGKSSGWSMDTDLSSVDASFIGEYAGDESGSSVSGVGDVNNDGYDDFIISAIINGEGGSGAGQTYLILGKSSGWEMDTDLSSADASFIGEELGDWSGSSVSGAGDVNNDGYDDFIIGAVYNDEGGNGAGQTYLILGKSYGWEMDTDLSSADASFIGEEIGDNSGYSISGAGDVDGDYFDDIIISARFNDEGGDSAGQSYLILGKSTGWAMDVDLSEVDGSYIGGSAGVRSGSSVSGVEDVNGDDYDDFMIGAIWADKNAYESRAGRSYLILGKSSGWAMDIDLDEVDASFIGEVSGDDSGSSVSGAGDVNNDGVDDFLIGASGNDEGGTFAGQIYLIFGDGNDPPIANGGGPYYVNEGSSILFDASGSSDPDSDTLQYRWDFNNDNVWDTAYSTSSSISYTWYDNFYGTVLVEVFDGELTDTDSISVTISNVNPSVLFTIAVPDLFILPGESISFQGTFTDPGTEDTHTILWTFGDDDTATNSLTQNHAYSSSGVFTVTLKITDDDAGFGTYIKYITIDSSANALQELIDLVKSLNLQHGISNALDSKLSNAQDSLEKLNNNNPTDAINKLDAFINEVEAQSGKEIYEEDADLLITLAYRIVYVLSN